MYYVRTLHFDRTAVQACIVYASALIGLDTVSALHYSTHCYRHCCICRSYIPNPQLSIEVDIVIPGEHVVCGQLSLGQPHELREACPGCATVWRIGDAC